MKIRILVAFGVALVAMAALPAMASARTIYSGMCGSDVVALQKRLAARSFLPPRYHTGCFDYRTSQAVVAFQGWVNFTRSGVATPLTQLRLKMSVRPRPGATQNYRHIEVIKSKQVALLITRKGIVRRTVHVSTARPGYSTPRGRYHIYAKARMSWSKPFQVWLPWASYVVGGIAFHSYPDVPTYPASPAVSACRRPRVSCSTASPAWAPRSGSGASGSSRSGGTTGSDPVFRALSGTAARAARRSAAWAACRAAGVQLGQQREGGQAERRLDQRAGAAGVVRAQHGREADGRVGHQTHRRGQPDRRERQHNVRGAGASTAER